MPIRRRPPFPWKPSHVFVLLIGVAIYLFFALQAFAADITLTYIAPTEYENNTPLDPLLELERYELGCSNTTGVYTADTRTWISSAVDMRTETFDQPGIYFCALRVKALDGFGGEFSDWSTEATFTIRSRPKPPTIVTVTVGGTG